VAVAYPGPRTSGRLVPGCQCGIRSASQAEDALTLEGSTRLDTCFVGTETAQARRHANQASRTRTLDCTYFVEANGQRAVQLPVHHQPARRLHNMNLHLESTGRGAELSTDAAQRASVRPHRT